MNVVLATSVVLLWSTSSLALPTLFAQPVAARHPLASAVAPHTDVAVEVYRLNWTPLFGR